MKFRLPLIVTALFCIFLTNVDAQNSTKQKPLSHVNYNDNVDAPLTTQERQMLEDVYGDMLEQDVLSRPQRLKDIKHILRNRIEIIKFQNKDLSSFRKLSEVPLFNIYNKSLTRDAFFNEATFNPLKYQFDFYSRHSSTFRVDNTDYLIIIKPQHLN